MNVCHLLNTAARGGAEMLVLELIKRTESTDVSYTVCYAGKKHELVPAFEQAGAEVICLGSRTDQVQFDPTVPIRFLMAARRKKFDILHAHMPYVQLLAQLVGRAGFVGEVISTYHIPKDNHPKASRHIVGKTQQFDCHSVAVSDGVRASFQTDGESDTRGATWQMIYNGIDITAFNEAVDASPPLGEFDTDGPVFLNIGRYQQQKGQQYLVRAMDRVTDTIPDAHAIIVGYGPEKTALRELVNELGLNESVTITGEVPSVKPYYARSDVFVFSSLFEGLPITGIEAMAAELPIVGTNVPGVEEVVDEPEAGLLVPPRSPATLADAMIEVVSERDCEQMGQRGFKRATRQFDIDQTVAAYLDLYRHTVSTSHGDLPAETVATTDGGQL